MPHKKRQAQRIRLLPSHIGNGKGGKTQDVVAGQFETNLSHGRSKLRQNRSWNPSLVWGFQAWQGLWVGFLREQPH